MKFISKGKGEVMQDARLGRNLRRWVCGLMLLVPALLMPGQSAALTVVSQQDVGNVTVMEVSGDFNMLTPQSTYNSLARADAAKAFFTTHRDEYDFLVFFTNFDTQMPQGVGGFYLPVHRDIQGIGKEVEDYSTLFGSGGRLMATIDMGDVHDKILDPVDPDFEGTLQVLTHELMHHWGAYVKFRAPDGSISSATLGLDGGHWSYLLDSNSSTLYGNHWRDNGDGTFTSIPPTTSQEGSSRGQLFSPLELYLMGINDQSQVPPLLLIKNPFIEAAQLPALDDTITGEASWVTIDDIIAAEGERVPAAADAQKNFRTAFIYLAQPGTTNLAQVADIESLRTEWVKRFSILTDGRGLMEVRSDLPINDGLASNPGVIDPTFTPNPTPTVNSGVSWLVSHQQTDGSWQDLAGTATRDTAAAVAALANFATANTSYQSGLTWLGSATPAGTDYLARQIESLLNKSAAVTDLLAGQNTDGGWGSDAGYLSNPTDSGLALQALASAGQSGAAVQAAVNYLLETQNADGGWGVASGTSMIQPTAHALQALNAYRGSYAVADEISQAITWLTSKQNGDGGFGNSPSTVYDTAAALVALRQSGGARSITDSGAAYLLTRQGTAGDWNGSAFQTALATDALWIGQVQADLSIIATDIAFNPASATAVPAPLTVTATVRNLGSADVSQAKVTLYAGDPSSGNLLDEKLVNVTGHGATPVVFSTTIASSGQHPLTVVIDPDRQLVEGDKTNNQAVKTFLIAIPPPVINFSLAAATVNEAVGTVNMQVNLDHPWDSAVTVAYNVSVNGTATPGTDFVLANGTLTFAPEETSKNIVLAVVDDALAENDETVIVDLVSPGGGTLGTVTRQTVTILDNEAPIVTIASPGVGISGDNTPLLNFTVSRGVPVVKVDGLVVSKVSGNELDPLTDGQHIVRVEAANEVGGVGYAEVSFTVDTKVPTVVITSPISGYVFENNPLLTYTVDTSATITVKVDGILVNKVSGEQLDILADGPHSVLVEATDSYARLGSAQVNFIVDTHPPTVKVIYPFNGILEESAPKLLYTTTGAGSITVMVDGVVTSKVSGDLLSTLPDGGHQLRVSIASPSGLNASEEVNFLVATGAEQAYGLVWQTDITSISSMKQLAIDAFGNTLVAGKASSSDSAMTVRKFDSRGALLWSKKPWGTYAQGVEAVGVDSSNSVYVGFTSTEPLDGWAARGYQDGYLAKFDAEGNKIWTRQIASSYSDFIYALYVDNNDFIYVAGLTGGTIGSGGKGDWSVFVTKYNKDGSRLWARQMYLGADSNPDNPAEYYVTVDMQGNVYLAGNTPGRLDLTATNLGGDDYYLIKYNSNGVLNWYLQGGTSQVDTVRGVGVDAFGFVYISGYTGGVLPGYTDLDGRSYIIKFDTNKELIWNHQWAGSTNSMVIEKDGNIFITGGYGLYKFNRDKVLLWSKILTENGYFMNGGLTSDSNGSVYTSWYDNVYYKKFIRKYSDQRLPVVSINKDKNLTNTRDCMISGSMDVGVDIKIITDNNRNCSDITFPTPTTWNCTQINLDEGSNTIKVIATKTNGFNNSDNTHIVLDTVPPSVSIITPGDWQTYTEKPILSYTVSDGAVKASLNGAAMYIYTAPLEELHNGTNILRVEAVDPAGNIGSDQVEFYAEGAAVGDVAYSVTTQQQAGTALADTVDESTRDAAGNIYVVGTTYGNLGGQTNNGLADAFLRKYDPNGNILWTKLIGTTANEYGRGIVLDNAGNIYVLWEVFYTSVKGTSQDWSNVIVGKYSPTGTQIWTSQQGSKQKDYGVGLAFDNIYSTVYVGGNTEGAIGRNTYGGGKDYFIAALTASSGSLLWAIQSSTSLDETISAVAASDTRGVFVSTNEQVTVGGSSHAFLLLYNLSGTVQYRTEIFPIGSNVDPVSTDIVIDSYGYNYVVGRVNAFDGKNNQYFIAKLRLGYAYSPLWVRQFGSDANDEATSVDLDTSGNLFVVGTSDGSLQEGFPAGGKDVFVAKMSSSDGVRKWVKQLGTTDDDIASSVLVQDDGTLFVTGHTKGQLGATSAGDFDVFLLKMTPVP